MSAPAGGHHRVAVVREVEGEALVAPQAGPEVVGAQGRRGVRADHRHAPLPADGVARHAGSRPARRGRARTASTAPRRRRRPAGRRGPTSARPWGVEARPGAEGAEQDRVLARPGGARGQVAGERADEPGAAAARRGVAAEQAEGREVRAGRAARSPGRRGRAPGAPAPGRGAGGARRASPGPARRPGPAPSPPDPPARCARRARAHPVRSACAATVPTTSPKTCSSTSSSRCRSSLTTSGASTGSMASDPAAAPTSSSATAHPSARMSATWPSSAAGRSVSARSVTSTATVIGVVACAYRVRSSSGMNPDASGSTLRKRACPARSAGVQGGPQRQPLAQPVELVQAPGRAGGGEQAVGALERRAARAAGEGLVAHDVPGWPARRRAGSRPRPRPRRARRRRRRGSPGRGRRAAGAPRRARRRPARGPARRDGTTWGAWDGRVAPWRPFRRPALRSSPFVAWPIAPSAARRPAVPARPRPGPDGGRASRRARP